MNTYAITITTRPQKDSEGSHFAARTVEADKMYFREDCWVFELDGEIICSVPKTCIVKKLPS